MIFSVRHTSVWKMSSVLGMLVHGECLQCQACSGDVFRVSHAGKMSSASRTLGGAFLCQDCFEDVFGVRNARRMSSLVSGMLGGCLQVQAC